MSGVLNTDFGLPAPVGGPISSDAPRGAFHYEAPSIFATGIAVDAENRPLITGATVTEVVSCYSGLRDLTSGYVARLSADGALDPSFGTSGTVFDSAAIQAEEPTIDRSGRLIYTGTITDLCGHGGIEETEVVALGADGQADPSFGSGGRVQIGAFWPESSAVDRQGRILLLAHGTYFNGHLINNQVLRLNPHGAADPTFGRNGKASFDLPHNAEISSLGVDGRGRPLLAGVARRGAARPSRFLIVRVTKGGKIDRGFGRDGSVTTGFRRKAGARADQVLVDSRGRILVSGVFNDPRYFFPTGVALARYSAGR